MSQLQCEVDKTRDRNFVLAFTFPTREELRRLAQVYRDMTVEEVKAVQKSATDLTNVLSRLEEGTLKKDDIPIEVWNRLKELLFDGFDQETPQ